MSSAPTQKTSRLEKETKVSRSRLASPETKSISNESYDNDPASTTQRAFRSSDSQPATEDIQLRAHKEVLCILLLAARPSSTSAQKLMVKVQSTLLLLFVLAIAGTSEAWTNMASAIRRLSTRASLSTWTVTSPTLTTGRTKSTLKYRDGVEYEKGTASSTSTTTTAATSNEQDTNVALQIALTAARDADRLHGLCSPNSIKAWAVVDNIFLSSSASREVESHVRRVLGHEKSIWDL